MKKLLSKQLVLTTMATFAFVCSGHLNADIVDISGVQTDGATPFVMQQNIGAGTVTGVTFNFGFSPITPSWSSEMAIEIMTPGGDILTGGSFAGNGTTSDVEFGGVNDSVPFSFIGGSGLLDNLSSGGLWTFTFTEVFDDPGQDGQFDSGSFIEIGVRNIPEPTALALLSVVGLGIISRRRR